MACRVLISNILHRAKHGAKHPLLYFVHRTGKDFFTLKSGKVDLIGNLVVGRPYDQKAVKNFRVAYNFFYTLYIFPFSEEA